ncbi:MAG: hypothetical protein ACRDTC_22150 [Pseudonocardiaceae bacterium]
MCGLAEQLGELRVDARLAGDQLGDSRPPLLVGRVELQPGEHLPAGGRSLEPASHQLIELVDRAIHQLASGIGAPFGEMGGHCIDCGPDQFINTHVHSSGVLTEIGLAKIQYKGPQSHHEGISSEFPRSCCA